MTRIGLIARCDNGGLGHLTWEFHRAVRPDRTLIVRLGEQGRGTEYPERYGELGEATRWSAYPIPDEGVEWLAQACDVIYTAEVPYSDRLFDIAHAHGCKVVLHAMPELYRDEYRQADEVWLPTEWRMADVAARMGDGSIRVVPVPVALDRFPQRVVERARGFLHVPGAAMLDRNGTDLVVAALQHVESSITVVMVGAQTRKIGNVTVLGGTGSGGAPLTVSNYWRLYQWDVLLLPRRYAGLSLPMQEAAAAGMPTLCLDRVPESRWPFTTTVPARPWQQPALMAGGSVDVYGCDPVELAAAIDRLATSGIAPLSTAAREWAERHSWAVWADRYRALLAEAATGEAPPD